MTLLIWLGIILCITQSAMFSGLNLAFFSISKLRLELEVKQHNQQAQQVLNMRKNANFLLVTILWGNVSVNVLLALLSGSVLAGFAAFLFSTVVITIMGEIIPQAYFSRHAISVAATLSPILRFYQVILYPVAKPTAFVLDRWLGEEAVSYYRERDVQELIKLHMQASDTEIDRVEGRGAINFLDLDDLTIEHEGEIIDPRSILQINFEMGKPVIPEIDPSDPDGFFQSVLGSQKKWVILTDQHHEPRLVLNADRFIREALLKPDKLNFLFHCHRPILIRDGSVTLDQVIPRFSVNPQHSQDDVIDEDIIILWSHQKKIITGSDLLGRLLRGIVQNRAFTIESSHAAEDPTSNEK